jgi:hypothetical protein
MAQVSRVRYLACAGAVILALASIPGATAGDTPEPKVEIGYGLERLPAPVQEMLLAIGEAIRSGDIEALKVAIQMNEMPPVIGDSDSKDQIAFLRSLSADAGGAETLAKLSLILDAGYAHVDMGGKDESFVWPYLAEVDLKALSPADRVRLHRIAPGAAAIAMEKAGKYTGWRLGISPTGVWHFLETGPAMPAQPAVTE